MHTSFFCVRQAVLQALLWLQTWWSTADNSKSLIARWPAMEWRMQIGLGVGGLILRSSAGFAQILCIGGAVISWRRWDGGFWVRVLCNYVRPVTIIIIILVVLLYIDDFFAGWKHIIFGGFHRCLTFFVSHLNRTSVVGSLELFNFHFAKRSSGCGHGPHSTLYYQVLTK